jgi:hypothetical protein
MINAEFTFEDNRYKIFTLSGHAESGPYGHDLVCAAVSALTIGTANNLSRIASIEPEIDADEENGGFIKVVLPAELDAKQSELGQVLLTSLHYSLLDIEESYGEYIVVSKRDTHTQ